MRALESHLAQAGLPVRHDSNALSQGADYPFGILNIDKPKVWSA